MSAAVPIQRWPGKPTSGRYVFRTRGGWYWQCDLHPEDESPPDTCGDVVPTMQEAFAGALAHAACCGYTALPLSGRHANTPSTK